MNEKIKEKTYRLQTITNHFNSLKKAVMVEIVEAGDSLTRIRNEIPLDEQRLLEFLFSGKHQSSILDAIVESKKISPEEFHLFFDQEFVDTLSSTSRTDDKTKRPNSPLNLWQIERGISVAIAHANICAANTMAKHGQFQKIPYMLRYAFSRLANLKTPREKDYWESSTYPANSILNAVAILEDDLQDVINGIPPTELELSRKLWSEEKFPMSNFIELLPLDVEGQKQVVFSGDYTKSLRSLRLKVKASDRELPAATYETQSCDLTHWQIKRAWHVHFSSIYLGVAKDRAKSLDIDRAIEALCLASKLIGAAGVPSFDTVEHSALSNSARKKANAKHEKKGGSKEKRRQLLEIWASGKYTTRTRCAEEECAAIGMSYDTARKALRNSPKPASHC